MVWLLDFTLPIALLLLKSERVLRLHVAFSSLQFQCEAMSIVFGVFSILCAAVATRVGLNLELTIFPRLSRLGVVLLTLWT